MHLISNLPSWSLAKKISFRFSFAFFALFIFLNNNGAFLYVQHLFHFPTLWLHQIIPWFSVNVLRYNYDFSIFTNGSGDTSYNYVLLLFIFLLAVFGSLIWSILDRKRKNYSKLYYWLIVLIRFYLAFTLMHYGSIKVVQLQFPQPNLSRLLTPLGEMSPMGLAWTFLGFSKGYNMFMGFIEVLSVLLLFKRTMVIGAFLSLAASVNVMAMNYFFDVPVKILSTALVVMCLFILAPYIVTILRFFLTYQPQQLLPLQIPVFKKRWQLVAFRSFKYLFIVWTVGLMVTNAFSQQYTYGTLAPKPPLYGIYNVEKYILNGKDILPQHADQNRWKQVVVDWKEYISIKTMDDNKAYFNSTVDIKKKQIEINSKNTESTQYKFHYVFKNDSTLIFKGLKDQDSLSVTLKKYNPKNIILPNRGFHWINEFPYNR
ncbi:hypothetical protein OQZ33_13885 [Pedobacter sp. MC2016-05]|uniref:hypothetical protein n=1 Tax=Pedobacter sp. MC2016-05 TaxID=2994474 RepID=UPI002248374B|nr:hypothetical protein [Pedobacter sp. MC2016-05]MCX2475423.1 hypothetical protein [Pedobacter sp. MC2016-05]